MTTSDALDALAAFLDNGSSAQRTLTEITDILSDLRIELDNRDYRNLPEHLRKLFLLVGINP